jgi:hypothetical protein
MGLPLWRNNRTVQQGLTFPTPISTRIVSNEEFPSLEQTAAALEENAVARRFQVPNRFVEQYCVQPLTQHGKERMFGIDVNATRK